MCKLSVCLYVSIILVSTPIFTRGTHGALLACSPLERRCPSGACVSIYEECGETAACTEENYNGTSSKCRRIRSPFPEPQSGQGACVLPPQPANGLYIVSGDAETSPGQALDSFELTVYCRRGFGFKGSTEGMDGVASQRIFCIVGSWSHSMPQCVRFCKVNTDPSLRHTCFLSGMLGLKPCTKYIPPGQAVRPSCNTPLYYAAESLPYMRCISGFWDSKPRCKEECGRITPEGEVLVIDGRPAKRGELPWHVGVYRKNTKPYTQICGGSLIKNHIVLSAAHCFWDDVARQQPASLFAVAIGKLYRDWDHANDVGAQKSDVKEIKLPGLFAGAQANYQLDMAVMVLSSPFVYMPFIRPVCLNFDKEFDRWQLRNGKVGKVAGWGLTGANGAEARILQVVDYPFVDIHKCIDTLPPAFREYITGDKFCAGFTNAAALCHGDSGGGLAFPDPVLGIDRYYLRGIVSAAPSTDGQKCNDATYSTFTKVSEHEDIIEQTISAHTKKDCLAFLFQCDDGTCVDQGSDCNGVKDCPDGSDEADDLCNLLKLVTTPQCVVPEKPDHGSITITRPNAKPGDSFESFGVTVRCDTGYSMAGQDGNFYKTTILQINCKKGNWDLEMPKCVQTGLVSWTPTDLDATIEEIFGPRDSEPEGVCNKNDGTGGQCVPYFKCRETATAVTEEEEDESNLLDPCSSGIDICCAFNHILPGNEYVKVIA